MHGPCFQDPDTASSFCTVYLSNRLGEPFLFLCRLLGRFGRLGSPGVETAAATPLPTHRTKKYLANPQKPVPNHSTLRLEKTNKVLGSLAAYQVVQCAFLH